VPVGHLDAIAALAREQLEQAPFPDVQIHAATARESLLRSYLGAFGVSAAPRLEPERPRTDGALAEAIAAHLSNRVDSLVYVLSPLPDASRLTLLGPALRRSRRSRTRVRWLHAAELPALEPAQDAGSQLARTAARLRSETERRAAELRLRRIGIESALCVPADAALVRELAGADPRGDRAA
jgi:hypothetical protein